MASKPTFEELEERRRKRWAETLDKTPIDWERSIQPVGSLEELARAEAEYRARATSEIDRILAKAASQS